MKRVLAILALVTLIWGCKKEEKAPSIAETMQTYTIAQMMDNEAIGGGSFSPDNSKLLISSNRSGIYNMYTIPTAGGEMLPITESDSSSVFAISYFPKDERMLFRMDNNGDEIYHIFVRDTDGTHKDLTPEEGARSIFYQWAQDKASFFYGSNKRDNRFMDLYEMDLESMTPSLVYQNDDGYDINVISPDKKYVALSKSINTNDSNLFLYNLEAKELTKINQNQSGNSGQDFSHDSSTFYYTTDDGSEFGYLMKYSIADGSYE